MATVSSDAIRTFVAVVNSSRRDSSYNNIALNAFFFVWSDLCIKFHFSPVQRLIWISRNFIFSFYYLSVDYQRYIAFVYCPIEVINSNCAWKIFTKNFITFFYKIGVVNFMTYDRKNIMLVIRQKFVSQLRRLKKNKLEFTSDHPNLPSQQSYICLIVPSNSPPFSTSSLP